MALVVRLITKITCEDIVFYLGQLYYANTITTINLVALLIVSLIVTLQNAHGMFTLFLHCQRNAYYIINKSLTHCRRHGLPPWSNESEMATGSGSF